MSGWRILLMVPVAYLGSALATLILFWAATGFPIGMVVLNDALHAFAHDIVAATVFQQVAMLGIAWLFMRRKMSFRDLGLGHVAWRDLGWGAVFFVGGFLVAYAANFILHATDGLTTIDLVYAMHAPWLEIPLLSAGWGLSSGIVYRGYVLQGLMRDWPSRTWLAVLVSGLLFAVPHLLGGLGMANVVWAALIGVLLALPVALRKGIWTAIIAEFLWDIASLTLLWAHLH